VEVKERKGIRVKYVGMLMIGVIFTVLIWFIFALIAGEFSDSLLVSVVLAQNIIICTLLVYIIDQIKKARSPR